MLSKKEIFDLAVNELKTKRFNNKIKHEKNLNFVSKICPEIKELQNSLNLTSIRISKAIFNQKKNSKELIEKIHINNVQIKNKISELLLKNNLPKNFLNLESSCKICKDYGIVNNEFCECFKKTIKKITAIEFQKNSSLKIVSFKDFNLNHYSKEIDSEDCISPYDQMKSIFLICQNFANNFPKYSNGLIMCGLTGLGKTHLSLAIANEIISNGFCATYQTAAEITRKMSDQYFKKDQTNQINMITEPDLLILDDIGSEFDSAFNKSTIFEIINIRTSKKLPLIISTNLSPKQLEEKYGQRVASRIFSSLNTLFFKGTDNRIKIKVNS